MRCPRRTGCCCAAPPAEAPLGAPALDLARKQVTDNIELQMQKLLSKFAAENIVKSAAAEAKTEARAGLGAATDGGPSKLQQNGGSSAGGRRAFKKNAGPPEAAGR